MTMVVVQSTVFLRIIKLRYREVQLGTVHFCTVVSYASVRDEQQQCKDSSHK